MSALHRRLQGRIIKKDSPQDDWHNSCDGRSEGSLIIIVDKLLHNGR